MKNSKTTSRIRKINFLNLRSEAYNLEKMFSLLSALSTLMRIFGHRNKKLVSFGEKAILDHSPSIFYTLMIKKIIH
jgi:hypothetical protein